MKRSIAPNIQGQGEESLNGKLAAQAALVSSILYKASPTLRSPIAGLSTSMMGYDLASRARIEAPQKCRGGYSTHRLGLEHNHHQFHIEFECVVLCANFTSTSVFEVLLKRQGSSSITIHKKTDTNTPC